MILLLNGSFGIGKSTVARSLAARLPRSVLFNPEPIGVLLQRSARLAGLAVPDFQDLAVWRRLTVVGVRIARMIWPNVIVPMAFSNSAYLNEIRSGMSRFEPRLFHFCLVAPIEVVRARLHARGADPHTEAWEYRRASECCAAHQGPEFSRHVPATARDADEIAQELLQAITT